MIQRDHRPIEIQVGTIGGWILTVLFLIGVGVLIGLA
jgi:hypothetical protein